MIVLVTGSRHWSDPTPVHTALSRALDRRKHDEANPLLIVHGGARGADRITQEWVDAHDFYECWMEGTSIPARWDEHHPDWCPRWCGPHRDYCVGAGPRRNEEMLEVVLGCVARGHEAKVLAFKTKLDMASGKDGTEDMVRRAEGAGLTVFHHNGTRWQRRRAEPTLF